MKTRDNLGQLAPKEPYAVTSRDGCECLVVHVALTEQAQHDKGKYRFGEEVQITRLELDLTVLVVVGQAIPGFGNDRDPIEGYREAYSRS